VAEAWSVTQEELLVTYERAWNSHDADACAACFALHGVRELRMLLPCASLGRRDPLLCGREEIAEHIGSVLDAVPDMAVEVLGAAYSSDRRLWTEWRATGTVVDDLDRRRDGGRPIEVLGVSVFRLSNDGFTEERVYWDSALVPRRAADEGRA
jgi:hypothetical protein